MRWIARWGLAVLTTLMTAGTSWAGVNLVFNGGFEQGFAGWSVPPNAPPPQGALFFVSTSGNAHEGSNFAHLSSWNLQFISQVLPGTVAGTEYELEFWARYPGSVFGSSLIVRWEGQVAQAIPIGAGQHDDWSRFSVPLTAQFGGSLLEFGQAVFPGEIHIDTISVRQVPAPSAMPLLALGGLAAFRRRRR
ncbi:MAG: PEP-CTERM sorting domain-containing protein [Phycisphaeraceae bacterium]|nr:PEP-CTERM sorting domain-containing protein [Phycisphaeraceae bacterium]